MPQPYLPTFKDKLYMVGVECIKARPKFEAAIGRCIALWAYVDNEFGGLFAILLKNESAAAHSVFLVLRRWSNQRQALDAAASTVLSGDTMATYKALMVEYGSLESQRNDLAHACFGTCPDDDDLLFMIKVEGTSKNTPSARPANQIQRISLNLTTGSGCDGAIGFL